MALERNSRSRQSERPAAGVAAARSRVSAAMGIGYCEGDPRSGLFVLDAVAAELLGLPAATPLSIADCRARIHPQDLLALHEAAAELLAAGDTGNAEFRCRGDGGATRSLAITACVERDADGLATQLSIGLRDISAARRTRSELREVRQRFNLLIDNADDVFWVVDWQARRQLYVSSGYNRCWGFDVDALMAGEPRWPDRIHRADRAAVAAAFEALGSAEEGDDHFAIEYRIVLDDGELRWIRDRGVAVRAEDGSIERVVGMAEDITDRRTVVRELAEREQNLHQAIDAAQLHVWTLHTPSRRLVVADLLCKMFGLNREACRRLGPWRRRLHPGDRARVETALRRLMTEGVALREEFRVQRGDGSITWLDARAILIADEDGLGAQVHGVAADVTERKQQEHQLNAHGRRLQLALDAAHLYAWTFDPETREMAGDAGLYPLFGKQYGDLHRARDWLDAVHPDDRDRLTTALKQALAADREFDVEFRVVQADGTIRWLRSQLVMVLDEGSAPIGYGVLGDVTERRRIEQQLRDSERELRTIAAAVPIGISRISRDLRYLFMNDAYAAWIRAATPEQLIGRSVVEVAGETALATVRAYVDKALSGQTVDYEMRVQLPLGERYIHASYTPEWNELDDEVCSLVAVTTDITERKRAEARLYEREREFKALAENAPDLIARVDRRLTYLYINRAAEAAFGISRDDYAGRTAAELGLPPQYVAATAEIITSAFAQGVEQEASFSIPDGRERNYFSARAVPEFDHDGVPESVLLIVYDISDRMRGQAERDTLLVREHEARKQAEASARGRDEFLAIVSHELRSPLNGIQNWAHVLESVVQGNGNKLMTRAIAGIKTGVEQQVRLIDDLLDATRIITGKLSLLLTPVKLAPVIAASVASVRDKAADKGVELNVEVELGDDSIDGDADRLQQIVWNLLSNAIKFTAAGGHVWLTARRESEFAVIRVRDDGRGIDGDFLPQLFERFRRDETGNSRGQGGLGLGLMLVRNLCELHCGSVVAASPGPGLGAEFTVRLPLRRADGLALVAIVPGPLEPSSLPSLGGLRLLLVDDHVESRDPLAVLLSQTGAVVDVLSSGEEAVQLVRRGYDGRRPDLLICDIAMPGQDGYETIRLIRAFERGSGQPALPAIAFTAFAQNEDRARALEAGFQTHIAKPVMVNELIAMIASLVPPPLPDPLPVQP